MINFKAVIILDKEIDTTKGFLLYEVIKEKWKGLEVVETYIWETLSID